MSRTDTVLPARPFVLPTGWRLDLCAALLAAMLMVAVQAAGGFPTLSDSGGDNDSLMRLVQIRDWLGGQGWSDLHQYRMGPDGGFLMHWSRIVDVPVAAIMIAVGGVTGSMAVGERVAEVVWPALLFAAGLFFLIGAARRLYGPDAVLPALLIGGITFNFMGIFTPRALDHHNLQLVLVLAALRLLLARTGLAAVVAGVCAAAMLAVGLETLPYVAVAGAAAAIAFLMLGKPVAPLAAGYGLGFGGAALLALAVTVPVSSWWAAQCDAYSAGLGIVAMVAGFGLSAGVAATAGRGPAARLGVLCLVGVAAAAVALVLVPQCFGDPYAGLDPRIKAFWLDSVVEAQPLWAILQKQPKMAPQHYITAFLGLALLGMEMRRNGTRFGTAMLAGFLAAAIAVSVWQVRGSTFSLALAAIPLSAWVARWRARAAAGEPAAGLRMAFAWLLSLSMVWALAAHGLANLAGSKAGIVVASKGTDCYADSAYATLASLPPTTVLAVSNLGSSILANTPHRALSGPYHRNVTGNLLVLDAFMGDAAKARAIMRESEAGILAFCPGNSESDSLAGWAKSGFMADLMANRIPDWLEPVTASQGQALALYRLRQD